MNPRLVFLLLSTTLGLVAGCTSKNGSVWGAGGMTGAGGSVNIDARTNTGGTTSGTGHSYAGNDAGTDATCETGHGFLCSPDLQGFPFTQFVVSYTDYAPGSGDPTPDGESTVTMTWPEPGKICLTGQVSPQGLAGFNFELATRTATGIGDPFDAATLGITQVALTVDSIPSDGLYLKVDMMMRKECPDDPLYCSFPPDFDFAIHATGQVIAPFTSLTPTTSGAVLDTSQLVDIKIQNWTVGDYEFCVRDLHFLDAQGNAVNP